MRVKKGLKDLNPTNLSFPEDTKIYVNNSLYVHTIGNYKINVSNFGIIKKIIRTLLSIVQLRSNRLKMVHIKASHMSTIWGLYFLRSDFPCLELFRYLQAVACVSKLCSSISFSICVLYLAIYWSFFPQFFFDDVYYLPYCLVYFASFCCSAAL